MTLKIGELFAGYGGLALGIAEAMDSEPAWYAEFDPAPSKIMAHHYPHLTNYGDVTAVDWATVPHVDIISGGSPCQDLSLAGARKGMTSGTRSNLWESMREAIAVIQPTYVVWENVRGALSAKATSDSDMESGTGLLGDGPDGHLRALGRVLGDLADLGYDCQWRGLRAADMGAPHGRFRVFILAKRRGVTADAGYHGGAKGDIHALPHQTGAGSSDVLDQPDSGPHGGQVPADANDAGLQGQRDSQGAAQAKRHGHTGEGTDGGTAERGSAIQDANLATGDQWRQSAPGQAEGGRSWADTGGRSGAPAADASFSESGERHGSPQKRGWADDAEQAGLGDSGSTTPHADSRNDAGRIQDQERGALERATAAGGGGSDINWGPYAPAIRRWEAVRGAAPAPTELTPKGKHRLSARFAEWMMGVPSGWITDVPDISRNDQLKAAGNGVVPQQAAAALRDMLAAFNEYEEDASSGKR